MSGPVGPGRELGIEKEWESGVLTTLTEQEDRKWLMR